MSMRDYVRRLVARISDRGSPMSRNRHFHTFATPLGRRALKLSKELRSLAQDIIAQAEGGGRIQVEQVGGKVPGVKVLLDIIHLKARRTVFLSLSEWELLLAEAGVREALQREA
jgi:hypothetical protein